MKYIRLILILMMALLSGVHVDSQDEVCFFEKADLNGEVWTFEVDCNPRSPSKPYPVDPLIRPWEVVNI